MFCTFESRLIFLDPDKLSRLGFRFEQSPKTMQRSKPTDEALTQAAAWRFSINETYVTW